MDADKEILLALGRLEGKVDALIAQQLRTQTVLSDLDKRVRQLESSRAMLIGVCTVLATGITYLINLFT